MLGEVVGSVEGDAHARGGGKLVDVFKKGVRAIVGEAVAEVVEEAVGVGSALEEREFEKGRDFGGEGDAPPAVTCCRGAGEIEGLDAEEIANEEDCTFAGIEEGEGEHADEAGEAVGAPVVPGGEENLGVGGGVELPAEGFEFGTDFAIVVDHAVEGEVEAVVGGAHGLVGAGRGIDDGEAAVGEGEAVRVIGGYWGEVAGRGEEKVAGVIGSTVMEAMAEAVEPARRDSAVRRKNDAGYSAHERGR